MGSTPSRPRLLRLRFVSDRRRDASRAAGRAPRALALVALALAAVAPVGAGEARANDSVGAKGPVGWDVYRRLDLLPQQRRGVQTRQFSSYDRRGGNDDGFDGTYSCLHLVPDGCLIAEGRGPGELESIWFTRDFGDLTATGNVRIRLDGRTVLDAPLRDVVAGGLGPPFAFPLVADAGESSGGAYIKVPMPFRRSMRVVTEHNPDFYHLTYRAFRDAAGVRTFDPAVRAPDVLAALRSAGRGDPKPRVRRRTSARGHFRAPARTRVVLTRLSGPGAVTALRIRLRGVGRGPDANAAASILMKEARLRITFDGHRTVDAPLGEFFGTGLGPARVRSLLFAAGPSSDAWLTAWWPMPFARSASFVLANRSAVSVRAGDVRVVFSPASRWRRALRLRRAGYFHATSHRGPTVPGRDWRFLRARGPGTFVGVTQTMRGPSYPSYLEGDERVFVNGSSRPQIQGTGTEDFYEGGWYFLFRPFTLPMNGFPARQVEAPACPLQSCLTTYRLMLGDAVPFSSSLDFGIEHGSENAVPAFYGSTAYWYGPLGPG